MIPRIALTLSLAGLIMVGCTSDLFAPVERASENVGDVGSAIDKLSDELDDVKDDVDDTVTKAREELQVAVESTGEEVKELEERLMKRLDELDEKVEARIEQVRASAKSLIDDTDRAAETRIDQLDEAVQARIDQIFAELRIFIGDTIEQIRELLKPVLTMVEKVSTNVDNGGILVAKVADRVTVLTDKVIGVVDEAKNTLLALRGKNPDGEDSGDSPIGGILGALGTVLSAGVIWWRRNGSKGGQKRWTEESIRQIVTQEVEKGLASEAGYAQIRERLIQLGVLKVVVDKKNEE